MSDYSALMQANISANPISAVLVVRNEIGRIETSLKALRPYVDEIVVVDQQSDDGTREAAESLADKVYTDTLHGYAEASFPFAFSKASSEWILLISPDEELTQGFAQSLRILTADPLNYGNVDSYNVIRRTTVAGKPAEELRTTRLFRRGSVHIPTHLHSEPEPLDESRVARPGYVCIVSDKTAEEQELDNQRYDALMRRGILTRPS